MENNNTFSEINENLSCFIDSITNSFTFFTGFNTKRKYRNRKFISYHHKGIIEEYPLLGSSFSMVTIKMLRRLIRK